MSDEKIVDKSVKIPAIKFSACEPLIPLFAISLGAMDKSSAEAPKVPAIGAQYLKISSKGGEMAVLRTAAAQRLPSLESAF